MFTLRQESKEEETDKFYNCYSGINMETDEAAPPGLLQSVCSPDPSESLRTLSPYPSERIVKDSNSKTYLTMQSFLEKCDAECDPSPAANSEPKEHVITQIFVDLHSRERSTTATKLNDNTKMIPKVINGSLSTGSYSLPVLDTTGYSRDDEDDDTSMTTSSLTSEYEHHEEDALIETSSTASNSTGTTEPEPEPALSEDIAVKDEVTQNKHKAFSPFALFRIQYLIVHTAIMLADGLQGTHLYVLYEGYGYSVSSLYSLGFVAGAITSPFIGPIVDKIGRKKAAMLYCFLEMVINYLELFPIFAGLIVSRMIGGITTNLLFSVFESWLVSEHRSRGFEEEKLEIILRDSTIVSNSAAILSGYLAHCLAANLGVEGPFQGAVVLTGVALILVWGMWTENYGTGSDTSEITTWRGNMAGAFNTIVNDSKISRIGLIQGLTEGSLQTFVFLWSPALRTFAKNAPVGSLGIDTDGEPAYGLIFGAFMACGVLGGFTEPLFRKLIKKITVAKKKTMTNAEDESGNENENGKYSVDFLCTICYLVSALLFLTPVFAKKDGAHSFTMCFGAFLIYELMVGLYMPCEGVIRSIYMPNESICSLMTMLRVIVNVAVALGVVSTNYVPFTSAFAALSVMMVVAAGLQLSLVPREDLSKVFGKFACTPFGASVNGKKLKVA